MINFEWNEKRFVSSLSWEFVYRNKLSGKEVDRYISKKTDMVPVGIKRVAGADNDRISLGFMSDFARDEVGSKLKHVYSMASILGSVYPNCIGLFEVHGHVWFVAVSNGCIVPNTDIEFDGGIKDLPAHQALITEIVDELFENVAAPKIVTNKMEFAALMPNRLEPIEIDLFEFLDGSAESSSAIRLLKGLSPNQVRLAVALVIVFVLGITSVMLIFGKEEVVANTPLGPPQWQKDKAAKEKMEIDGDAKSVRYFSQYLGEREVAWVSQAFKKARFIPRHVAGYQYKRFICLNKGQCETFWAATRTADPGMFIEHMKRYDAGHTVRFTLDGESASKVISYGATPVRVFDVADVKSLPGLKTVLDDMIFKSRHARRLDFNLQWKTKEPTKKGMFTRTVPGSKLKPLIVEYDQGFFSLLSTTSHSLYAVVRLFNERYLGVTAFEVTINKDHSISWTAEGRYIAGLESLSGPESATNEGMKK